MPPTSRGIDLTALERPKYRDATVRKGPETITASATVRSSRWTAAARLSAGGDQVTGGAGALLRVTARCLPAIVVVLPIGLLFHLNGYLVLGVAVAVVVCIPVRALPRRGLRPSHRAARPPASRPDPEIPAPRDDTAG